MKIRKMEMSCSLCHWIHHFLAIIYKMCHRPNDLGQCEAVFCGIARQLDHSPPYPKSAICQFRTLTALTWHGNQHHQPAPVILLNITSVLVLSPDIVPSQNGGFAPEVGISPFSHLGNVRVPFSDTSKKTKNSCELQQPLVKSPKSFLVKSPNFPVKAPQKPSSARSLADQASLGRSSRNWGRRWSWRSIFTWGKQGNNAKDVPSIDPKT